MDGRTNKWMFDNLQNDVNPLVDFKATEAESEEVQLVRSSTTSSSTTIVTLY